MLAVSRSTGIDVTALDAADRILERLDGRAPDILVNNAGTSYAKPLDELSEEDWQLQWDLNVMASMRLMRAFVPQMAERGWGRVVNVASSAGKRPSLTNAAYSVGKAAQASLSRVFADTYARRRACWSTRSRPARWRASCGWPRAGSPTRPRKARGLSREEAIEVQDGQGAARALRHAGGDRERRRLPLLRARGRRHRRQLVGRRRLGCNHRLKRRQSPSMPPAARVGDMHTCPMVTGVVPHVGGPILPPGVPDRADRRPARRPRRATCARASARPTRSSWARRR